MRLRREARLLKGESVASFKRMARTFNDYEDEGRHTAVLLSMQHAFEQLLKAGLRQRRVPVFDAQSGRSIGFKKCVNLARQHLGLSEEDAGLLRAVNALRDEAQHWVADVPEGLLYAHCRGAVTLFDTLLHDVFDERLAHCLPERVLPISTEPPRDVQLLIDEEYRQVRQLLQPGRRRRAEARARIRTLLALEGHVREEPEVSERDVDRAERGVRGGRERGQVFPSLDALGTQVTGEGLQVSVRFVHRGGTPVTHVSADDDVEAAAIREVDLQKKYHRSPRDLARALSLTVPKCGALRWKLGIDEDAACRHEFTFGKSRHVRYSDTAFTRLRDALDALDVDEAWREYRARPRRAVTAEGPAAKAAGPERRDARI